MIDVGAALLAGLLFIGGGVGVSILLAGYEIASAIQDSKKEERKR